MLSDHACWRRTMKEGIEKADVKRHQKAEEKRARHKTAPLCPPRPLLQLHVQLVQ